MRRRKLISLIGGMAARGADAAASDAGRRISALQFAQSGLPRNFIADIHDRR
jgi:hypothetical protein